MQAGLTIGGSGTAKMHAGLRALNGSDVLVGIPEGDNRSGDMLDRAANMSLTKMGKTSRRAMKLAKKALAQDITNAELMFIHTNGSPIRGIPPRPVIEPAIAQPDTAAQIAKQLGGAAVAALDGNAGEMKKRLDRAGQIGESASKRWFTSPKNNWAPNTPQTIKAKGSDKPLIDTGTLRRAITHVVEINSAGKTLDDDAESQTGTDAVFTTHQDDFTEFEAFEGGAETLAVII